jgi:hypothetical protein
MLNPAIASATLNQIIQPGKIKSVGKSSKKWHKFDCVKSDQDTFGIILAQVERNMPHEDSVELMTLTPWDRHLNRTALN